MVSKRYQHLIEKKNHYKKRNQAVDITNTKILLSSLPILELALIIHIIMKLTFIYTLVLSTMFSISSALPLGEKRSLSSCLAHAKLTKYWIPKEGEEDMTNDGKSVKLTGSHTKALKTANGDTIAKVSDITWSKFQMEGTGLLSSGVMVNLGINNNVFVKLNRGESPYGLGSQDHINLEPWVSVASNDLEIGTTLYIKELDGVSLPNGKVHNGCVRVDDKGWGLQYCQIDFFVLQFSAFKELSKTMPTTVNASQKSCHVKNYITTAVQKWAVI
jgi:hypothetical protein